MLARKGLAGAYPIGTGTQRKVWVFRLSEVAAGIANSNWLRYDCAQPSVLVNERS